MQLKIWSIFLFLVQTRTGSTNSIMINSINLMDDNSKATALQVPKSEVINW